MHTSGSNSPAAASGLYLLASLRCVRTCLCSVCLTSHHTSHPRGCCLSTATGGTREPSTYQLAKISPTFTLTAVGVRVGVLVGLSNQHPNCGYPHKKLLTVLPVVGLRKSNANAHRCYSSLVLPFFLSLTRVADRKIEVMLPVALKLPYPVCVCVSPSVHRCAQLNPSTPQPRTRIILIVPFEGTVGGRQSALLGFLQAALAWMENSKPFQPALCCLVLQMVVPPPLLIIATPGVVVAARSTGHR